MLRISFVDPNDKTISDRLPKINAFGYAIISINKKTKRAKAKLKPFVFLINLAKSVFQAKNSYAITSSRLKQYCNSENLREPLELIEARERAEKCKSIFKSPV